jgi:hypothetical protein
VTNSASKLHESRPGNAQLECTTSHPLTERKAAYKADRPRTSPRSDRLTGVSMQRIALQLSEQRSEGYKYPTHAPCSLLVVFGRCIPVATRGGGGAMLTETRLAAACIWTSTPHPLLLRFGGGMHASIHGRCCSRYVHPTMPKYNSFTISDRFTSPR